MKKTGSAEWEGSVKEGSGALTTESGVLDSSPYGFNTRFEDGPGTNPEELIGAAHAGCFSMAFSMLLGQEGFTPSKIATTAEVSLEKQADGFAITSVHLDVQAHIPGIDEDKFTEIANKAKVGCPVSKLLNAESTMEAYLSQ